MYIEPTQTYYVGTEQRSRRARFLILLQPDTGDWNKYPIRAVVRKVALSQVGCWMMGSARIGGKKITLSGSYGSDGLPKSVPMEIYEKGVVLPDYLVEAWSKGGGWNSAGSESQVMAEWANKTFQKE